MQEIVTKHSCRLLNNYKLCYWDNNNTRAKKVLMFFSGGFDDGSELKEISGLFSKDMQLLSPCFPGRCGSHSLMKFDSFSNIANMLQYWLECLDLKDKEVFFWGTSYGTAVLNELIKITDVKISGIILLTPGEFLDNSLAKELLKKGFKNSNSNKSLRVYLQKILHLFYPFNNERFLKDDAKSLNEQWLATLAYKVDTSCTTSTPTLIINCSNDKIIATDSIQKIYIVYPNHKLAEIEHEHIINFFEEKPFIKKLIEQKILPFIYDCR